MTPENQPAVHWPNDTQRTAVIGSTGSGKSYFGMWLMGTRQTLDWVNQPVVIFDWKGDANLNNLGAKRWSIYAKPPTRPGLYIVHPLPGEVEPVDVFLVRCWEQEDIGLFFDEASELEKSKAINRVMKQGRAKHIPCISCTQRPVWLPRSVFSEADYFAILRLNDQDDKTTVKRFVNADVYQRLPPHYSLWYAGSPDKAVILRPVPNMKTIRGMFYSPSTESRKRIV